MAFGVTTQMIEAFGEIVFKLSLNKQRRKGDAVRLLDFAAMEAQRAGTGLTDEEIGARIGLLTEQVSVVRVFMERKYHRIDQHRRIFHLGGGRRWNKEEYQHPRERLKFSKEAMTLREALTFPAERAAHYIEQGYWKNETLSGWLAVNADRQPDAPAVIQAGGRISYVELKNRVDRLTRGLMALGLMKGDVVAVQLPNSAEFIISYLAIAAFGGVMQAIRMPYGEKDMRFFLGRGKARAVIFLSNGNDFSAAEAMVNSVSKLENLEHVIAVGVNRPAGSINFADLMSDGGLLIPNPPVGADPLLLFYTSGGVSGPKGVPLTYQNLLSSGRLGAAEFDVMPDDRIFSTAPLSDPLGLFSFHVALCAGAATALIPAFSAADMARSVEREKISVLFLGPPQASALLDDGRLDSHDFSSLRLTVFSGSHVPSSLLKEYQGKIPDCEISRLWGMAEVAAGTYTRLGQNVDVVARSVGQAAPGHEIRVVSQEGETLPPGREGELQVRGCSLFPGYLDNPGANAKAFAEEGWFRTGELGVIDEGGNLELKGRSA